MWIEVFKKGTHTDAAGNTKDWTDSDLKTIVDKYNNQPEEDKHEAPVVVGHPDTDSPAYGWVEELKVEGDKILAKLKDLTPQFVEWVKKGLYKKRSISLYSNLLLKHIGFLGGVPPAVKGLADPAFENDAANDFTTIEFAEIDRMIAIEQQQRSARYGIEIKNLGELGNIAKPMKYQDLEDEDFADPVHYRLPIARKYVIATIANWSKEKIKQQYTEQEQQIINDRINQAANKFNIKIKINNNFQEIITMNEQEYTSFIADLTQWAAGAFNEEVSTQLGAYLEENRAKWVAGQSESEPAPAPKEMSEKTDKRDKEMLEMALEIENLKKENRRNAFKNYVESLIKDEGKLLPAQQDLAIATLELGVQSGKIKFSEAGKTKESEGVDLIKRFMESYEKKIDITPLKSGSVADEFDANGQEVDKERLALDKKIKNYIAEQAKQGVVLTYAEALTKVINL